jgi:hypothetical protein
MSPRPLLLIRAPPVFLNRALVTTQILLVPQHPEVDKSGILYAHDITDQDTKWDFSQILSY